jgi:predicted acyltransferase
MDSPVAVGVPLSAMPQTLTPASARPVAVSASPASARLASVDALRGFDMFWIIGAGGLFHALKTVAGGNPVVNALADQLDHVPWQGLRFYDLIFPLFVFIVGVSIVLALSRRLDEAGRGAAAAQVFRRFAILYLLGLFAYGGIAEGVGQIRLLGVLQRIALCYLFGALAFLYLKPKALAALCATLLVGYWAVMTFVPVPGFGAGNFEEGKNLANYVDAHYLPLRKWNVTHDPEGLLSTIPAIATCLLGIFAGLLLRRTDLPDRRKLILLTGAGVAALLAGYLWSVQFPIIKQLWTSSYVLVAAGYSALFLALFYYVIEVRKQSGWAVPFVWIGTNAITIYMLTRILKLEPLAARLVGGEIKTALDSVRNGLGDLLIAVVALGIALLFCRFLYQRRIFLKV